MASLKLKLVIDKRENRVLFAEAGKDFVDFIFRILTVPIGTMVRTLSDAGVATPGSLGNLFEIVKYQDDRCTDTTNTECLLQSEAAGHGGGYVNPQMTYMVMDNLAIRQLSVVSVLSLIGPPENDPEIWEVDFGRDEELRLLKAVWESKTVLTDVFLKDAVAAGAPERRRLYPFA